jgi:ubiquinone/menaquinone biosynthesis C-methylase UbiE
VTIGSMLLPEDVTVFEEIVVPSYLSYFASLAVDMLMPYAPATIAHIGCRTGFPDNAITDKLPGSAIVGVDTSASALDLARSKASLHSGMRATYQVGDALPTALPNESFTHALAIHPLADVEGRSMLLAELRRILLPGGQALLALPVRGSYPELNDMIREFALRQDLPNLSKAVDVSAQRRPTIETISEEFENAGLTEVDVDVQLIAVSFNNGREFLEDPIARLMVMPDMRVQVAVEPPVMEQAMQYLHEAILKYWSEGVFELTVNVGCASGRRF